MTFQGLAANVVSFASIGVVALTAGIFPASAKVEGDVIVLGSVVSFTGKYSTTGTHTKNGYDLAVKRINEAGGVKVGGKSYKFRIKYYDDKSKSADAAKLAERLIRQDGIKFMLGPYSSGLTKAVAPVTEKFKIPMVEANGAARTLFTKGYRYLFGVLSTTEQYLSGIVPLAAEIAKKNGRDPADLKLAIVTEQDPFSLDIRAGVIENAKDYGIKVIIDDNLPPDLSDMTGTLTKVRELRPDILIVVDHAKGARTAVRQIKEMKIDVPMIAMTHCEAAKIIKKFGKAAEGILCPTQWAATLRYKDKIFGTAQEFSDAFVKAYKDYARTPYQAAESAAAVLVLKNAFERANSFDTEKIRNALASTNMQTFYGFIKFAPTGQNIAKPMVLRQVQNGKLNVVAPLEWAVAPVIYPRRVPE